MKQNNIYQSPTSLNDSLFTHCNLSTSTTLWLYRLTMALFCLLAPWGVELFADEFFLLSHNGWHLYPL
jgi:hypothetical protein